MTLKLMVDYNLGQPVVNEINRLGAVKAKTTVEYGYKMGEDDAVLINGTKKHGCILLTADVNTINERAFEPCTHGGVILIKKRRPSKEQVFDCVKKFCQSGKRALAARSVTHLYDNRAVVHTCEKTVEIRL